MWIGIVLPTYMGLHVAKHLAHFKSDSFNLEGSAKFVSSCVVINSTDESNETSNFQTSN